MTRDFKNITFLKTKRRWLHSGGYFERTPSGSKEPVQNDACMEQARAAEMSARSRKSVSFVRTVLTRLEPWHTHIHTNKNRLIEPVLYQETDETEW